jgi:hypothetical protein
MNLEIQPVSFSYETAAAATGLSADVLKRAVRSGDLTPRYPEINGRAITKPVFEREELERFIRAGKTERAA